MKFKKIPDLLTIKEGDHPNKSDFIQLTIKNIHGNPPRQYTDGISDEAFIQNYQAYLYIPFVTYTIFSEPDYEPHTKEADKFRQNLGLSRRQFVLSNYLFSYGRQAYLEMFGNKLDNDISLYNDDIPYPNTAEILERLRLNAEVSRRCWVESHLDDYQKQVYLKKYGNNLE
ncbi:MAG: hypothetical protein IKQ61_02455 [Spirochaetales bacterium]|jgi:hypothetical protein|nr:hypothetical protein [Spirochaetales bacterium]MBR6199107.1 hypothetical protein [Spirochaetales bacterium]